MRDAELGGIRRAGSLSVKHFVETN